MLQWNVFNPSIKACAFFQSCHVRALASVDSDKSTELNSNIWTVIRVIGFSNDNLVSHFKWRWNELIILKSSQELSVAQLLQADVFHNICSFTVLHCFTRMIISHKDDWNQSLSVCFDQLGQLISLAVTEAWWFIRGPLMSVPAPGRTVWPWVSAHSRSTPFSCEWTVRPDWETTYSYR